MPISVRFARRPGYDTLQIRITIDGAEGSPFATTQEGKTIQVSGVWDQKKQKRTDRSESAKNFNTRLDKIRVALFDICDRQRTVEWPPTPKSVQLEYQTGERPEQQPSPRVAPRYTLLAIHQAYLDKLKSYIGTENQLAASTLGKWTYGSAYLTAYLLSRNESSLGVDQLSVGWAKDYHTHLMRAGPMSADSATRYLKKMSEALDDWVDYGTATERRLNPIAAYQFGRAKTKEVYFLEKAHISKFWQLDNRGEAGVCIWWMGLVLLTGLDYPDAVRYVQNRIAYDRVGNVRPSICIRRSKPPKAECQIPVWPELTALLTSVPLGDPPSAEKINDYMLGVEVLINFPHRFTLKIGRKTAGYIFLLRGYTIQAVSRIMGHSSIAITERYYVKVTGELVEQETDNL